MKDKDVATLNAVFKRVYGPTPSGDKIKGFMKKLGISANDVAEFARKVEEEDYDGAFGPIEFNEEKEK